ncbi:quinol monooxygenase YgiN [Kineococcus radiotolerans]|uniref:Quinol monooxygenase YgiN n=1 Tax=Kineococcus radiotolerans TaxID=131568 RepID=A0A7W4TRH2_KINRA|nr:antibiotic biosynthesis monooxygenase [Kineococcus radiotolerans]MBB2903373.1 quinol monooxygenase YgiN [Kineococcus radiotolerans]
MPAFGFSVQFDVRPGKEEEVIAFFEEARELVGAEPGTLAWFAFRHGPNSFRIFDAFDTETDREIHLHGEVRKLIEARGEELFATPPVITPVDVVAAKLPAG